ncbi:MAG: hypothetical protein KJ749_04705, partial [Planctomycetes bacterium]|nr:hypothetical protein [Planctomycetota bacterium]
TTGQRVDAISALRAAIRALPNEQPLQRSLAGLLATTPQAGARAKQEAIQLAQECCQADTDDPENFGVLGIAYAAAGDFDSAIIAARRAVSLARSHGKTALADNIALQLKAYEQGRSR